jgi:hypothetical protein
MLDGSRFARYEGIGRSAGADGRNAA